MKEELSLQTSPKTLKDTVRQYYKQLYAHEFDNVDEMDQCIKKQKINKTYPKRNKSFE
jgi:ribosomal protein L19E